jgi:DNA polymerase III alpha subunit
MKCHHPDVFLAAILNAQPMGFYAPAQLVRDAERHGVEIRPPDVNRSRWDCTLEPTGERFAVRLGLRTARGLANRDGALIVAARGEEAFASVEDLWRRARVPVAALERLAEADAFGSPARKSARRLHAAGAHERASWAFLTTALAPRHIERARILAAQTLFTKSGSLAGLF